MDEAQHLNPFFQVPVLVIIVVQLLVVEQLQGEKANQRGKFVVCLYEP